MILIIFLGLICLIVLAILIIKLLSKISNIENNFYTFISDIDTNTWIRNKDAIEETLNKEVIAITENKHNPKLKEVVTQ